MTPWIMVSICLKVRRAVAERWITSRRVLGVAVSSEQAHHQLRFNDRAVREPRPTNGREGAHPYRFLPTESSRL